MSHQPTHDEQAAYAISSYRGMTVGLGNADPGAAIAAKLTAQYAGHLVLVQAGGFLHGYDRTAFALHTLKRYKLMLVGTAAEPHLRIGFPVGNFRRRLWPLVAEFGIPYVVALGVRGSEHTVYASTASASNAHVLDAVSPTVVADAIADLRQHQQLNLAAARELLGRQADTSAFHLKTRAQDLDYALLQDLLRMPRDVRSTFGENVRSCMARIVRNVMAYGLEEEKPALLRSLSAEVDLLKHYLAQVPRLKRFEFAFEHRVASAVELGRLVGGLIRAQQAQP